MVIRRFCSSIGMLNLAKNVMIKHMITCVVVVVDTVLVLYSVHFDPNIPEHFYSISWLTVRPVGHIHAALYL